MLYLFIIFTLDIDIFVFSWISFELLHHHPQFISNLPAVSKSFASLVYCIVGHVVCINGTHSNQLIWFDYFIFSLF